METSANQIKAVKLESISSPDICPFLACTVVPAGMKSTEIRANQISTSSTYSISHKSIYARLDHPKLYWSPAKSDYDNPWLQVDFKSEVTVDGIDTQGGGLASYVKTFTVNKGSDGILFDIYKEDNVEKVKYYLT